MCAQALTPTLDSIEVGIVPRIRPTWNISDLPPSKFSKDSEKEEEEEEEEEEEKEKEEEGEHTDDRFKVD